MTADIALPKNNEEEFIEAASKLGIKKLIFLYDFDEYHKNKIQEKIDLIKNKKINLQTGFIMNQKNISRAFKISKLLVAKSSDNDRFLIESKKINLIYGFEEIHKKDFLHQRASGLNHIICGLANKNNVAIGFAYSSLFNKNNQALVMGRMMQNIALCKKYKVKTVIGSFSQNAFHLRTPQDLASLFALLGMDAHNIRYSLSTSL
ncbi:hypothetical protein HYX05_04390 [Candidatus Woesearchaeota archaeon]|nr:hypothetical protein [Candidatus Woesearchaeota archaeon]